jgi:hypothetical protein
MSQNRQKPTCELQQTTCTWIWMILHCGLINEADTREAYCKKLVHRGMVLRVCLVGAENRKGPQTCNGLRCVRLRGKAAFLVIGGRAPKWEPLNGGALEAAEG